MQLPKFSIPANIFWYEGMLLSHEHLRQTDKRNESLVIHGINISSPYRWGVSYLAIDELLLQKKKIRITALDAILPSGQFIHYRLENFINHPLDISITRDHNEEEIEIYLNYQELLAESNENQNDCSFPWKLSLSKPGSTSAYLIIAKIRNQNAAWNISQYLPPRLNIRDTNLEIQCRQLALQIRNKANLLLEIRNSQIGSPLVRETDTILTALVTELPFLEQILYSITHPYDIYLQLLKMLGHLACLKFSMIPPLIEPYNHHEILKSFNTLYEIIENYINAIDQSHSIIHFNQKGQLFYLPLNISYIDAHLHVGLKIPATTTAEIIEEWMMDAVIASDFAIDFARNRRITGASRRKVDHVGELDVVANRGLLIFEILYDNNFISVDQNLNIFNSSDTAAMRPQEILFFVKRSAVITRDSSHNLEIAA